MKQYTIGIIAVLVGISLVFVLVRASTMVDDQTLLSIKGGACDECETEGYPPAPPNPASCEALWASCKYDCSKAPGYGNVGCTGDKISCRDYSDYECVSTLSQTTCIQTPLWDVYDCKIRYCSEPSIIECDGIEYYVCGNPCTEEGTGTIGWSVNCSTQSWPFSCD